MAPHNVPFVILGAGILWFGWFGFNAGSALASNALASSAFVNTQLGAAAAVLGWIIIERDERGAGTLDLADGDGPIEGNHGRGHDREQMIVESGIAGDRREVVVAAVRDRHAIEETPRLLRATFRSQPPVPGEVDDAHAASAD